MPARAKRPTADEYRKLATGVEKLKPGDLHRFWFQLGEAVLRAVAVQPTPEAAADMRSVAITCFQEAAKADPLDLTSRAVLVDIGDAAKRQDVVNAAIAEIEKIEGPDGPIANLSQVVVRLPGAKGKPDEIEALRKKAEKVRESRQGWGRVYLALAQLDELGGRNDDVLAHYRQAIDHGERTEFVIRKAVELLFAQKKDEDAYKLLNSLYTEVPLPDDLERFRAIKDLLARDLPRSERPTIERIAPPDSSDYRILLLRGSLLAAIGEGGEALKAFRLAVDRDDTVPETWASLVAYLVRVGKPDEAKEAVAQGERRLKNNPPPTVAKRANLIQALAECYDIVGDRKTAGERYQQAVDLQPRELDPNRRLVHFLQRSGQGDKAAELLEKLSADPAPDLSRWARRHYATLLIAGPRGYDQRHKALALIEKNLQSGTPDSEDRKAKAIVQTIDPETRKEGERTLREFADRGDLTPDEYYMLARLYFDSGRVVESVEFFAIAARPRQGVTPEHLAGLVRAQLALADKKNSNDLGAADRALERLKAMAPGSWEAVREEARLLHRRAQLAARRGDTAEVADLDGKAKKLIAGFSQGKPVADLAGVTGPLLEELGFAAEAEAIYRQLLDGSKSPAAHRSLAVFLLRQKRSAEAIELARKHEATAPMLLTAGLLSGAVKVDSPGPAAEQQVLDWLAARLKEAEARPDGRPVVAALLGMRAQIYDAQGKADRTKYDAAIAEYKRALSHGPSDLATNNLAMLIALHTPGQVRDAIELMDKLIGVKGPVPEFLDTRAVCYLVAGGAFKAPDHEGKEVDGPELARRDLEMAVLQRREPAYLFHLAWAYQLKGDQAQLLLRMTEALKEGATTEVVHPLEAPKFRELSALAGR